MTDLITVYATTSPAATPPTDPSPTPESMQWGWLPTAGILLGAVMLFTRRRHNPGYRRNIDAFTDAEGRIRPIRGSEGYDDDVETIDREERERESQAERYRGVERGRESIQRPPWARGFSQDRIEQIAKDAGRSPYEENWWQGARLYPGTGEYRAAVLEGVSPTRHAHETRAHRAPRSRAERMAERREQRRVIARAGEDLPW